MGKSFRADELNQSLLFPPSLHDWLPDNHLARFLADVVNALDLDAIYASYNEKDGSRKIQAKTYDDVAFRFLSADEHPDHSTLAEFRKRHLTALAGLFTQALLFSVNYSFRPGTLIVADQPAMNLALGISAVATVFIGLFPNAFIRAVEWSVTSLGPQGVALLK